MRKLKLEVEKAKKIISAANATDIVLDIGEESLDVNLTREKFQFLNKKHFDKIIPIVEKCLEEAKLKRQEIDEIIMVGGSSRIPYV